MNKIQTLSKCNFRTCLRKLDFLMLLVMFCECKYLTFNVASLKKRHHLNLPCLLGGL